MWTDVGPRRRSFRPCPLGNPAPCPESHWEDSSWGWVRCSGLGPGDPREDRGCWPGSSPPHPRATSDCGFILVPRLLQPPSPPLSPLEPFSAIPICQALLSPHFLAPNPWRFPLAELYCPTCLAKQVLHRGRLSWAVSPAPAFYILVTSMFLGH